MGDLQNGDEKMIRKRLSLGSETKKMGYNIAKLRNWTFSILEWLPRINLVATWHFFFVL